MTRGASLVVGATLIALACEGKPPAPTEDAAPRASVSVATLPAEGPPKLLYLPDGGDIAPPSAPESQLLPGPGPWVARSGRCPAEMVDVQGRFCIDRWEAILFDAAGGRKISPHYHPTRKATSGAYGRWLKEREQSATEEGRSMAIPAPPDWQLREEFEPRAESRPGVLPNGYVDRERAERACKNAGKRLCREEEWVVACRGHANRKFPYGDTFESGRCNVFRESHPASVLHGNPSINHSDPRLNLVSVRGRPLLRTTGTTPECKSEWGSDAIYDMVGNLDEWIDDPEGTFVGGFFSRGTREGCDSKITSHGPTYYDYSLGVRCCK